MDILTLHRDENRHSFYADKSWPAIFFEDTIKSWVVMDPGDCDAILRMPMVRPGTTGASSAYQQLERRYGYSFPNLAFAFQHVPLCIHGPRHREVRRRWAEFLSAGREDVAAELDLIVERSMASFTAGNAIDLVQDFFAPLVKALLCAVARTPAKEGAPTERASIIFDRMIGIRKRLQLEEEIGTIRAMVRQSLESDATEEEEGLRLSVFSLGNDALVGSLSESFYWLLKRNPGERLSDISYPALPNETGVPFVERVVDEEFEYGGHRFEIGARIKVLLQMFAYAEDAADRGRIFGSGSHACLGRSVSLDIWRRLTARLSQVPLRAEILGYEMRAEDYVFTVPSKILIRLSA